VTFRSLSVYPDIQFYFQMLAGAHFGGNIGRPPLDPCPRGVYRKPNTQIIGNGLVVAQLG